MCYNKCVKNKTIRRNIIFMAMIDPPIEKLIDKAGSRYALVTVISKRAKELLLEKAEFFKDNQKIKPIEYASD